MIRSNALLDAIERLATTIADWEVDVQELLERQLIDRKSKEESREIQAAKKIRPGNWEKEYHTWYMNWYNA